MVSFPSRPFRGKQEDRPWFASISMTARYVRETWGILVCPGAIYLRDVRYTGVSRRDISKRREVYWCVPARCILETWSILLCPGTMHLRDVKYTGVFRRDISKRREVYWCVPARYIWETWGILVCPFASPGYRSRWSPYWTFFHLYILIPLIYKYSAWRTRFVTVLPRSLPPYLYFLFSLLIRQLDACTGLKFLFSAFLWPSCYCKVCNAHLPFH
jgi:hypothetical protein